MVVIFLTARPSCSPCRDPLPKNFEVDTFYACYCEQVPTVICTQAYIVEGLNTTVISKLYASRWSLLLFDSRCESTNLKPPCCCSKHPDYFVGALNTHNPKGRRTYNNSSLPRTGLHVSARTREAKTRRPTLPRQKQTYAEYTYSSSWVVTSFDRRSPLCRLERRVSAASARSRAVSCFGKEFRAKHRCRRPHGVQKSRETSRKDLKRVGCTARRP